MTSKEPEAPPSPRTRVVTIITAFAVAALAIGFLAFAFRSDGASVAAGADAPDEARVSCLNGGVEVEATEVNVQADGLHVSLEADFDQAVLTIFPEEGGLMSHGLGNESGKSSSFLVPISPGEVRLECSTKESGAPSEDATFLTVTDPEGYWHESAFACGQDIIEWSDAPFYYTDDNPFPEAVLATLPGVQQGDEVSYAGYPEGDFAGNLRVVREGKVVGEFSISEYDQRSFLMPGVFCKSSGIGAPEAVASGTTATPFSLPDYEGCDPYSASCSSIFVSARWFEEYTGESPELLPPSPWSICNEDYPKGCKPEPEDMIVRVVTTPADSARFEDEFQCGATDKTACL